MVMKFLKIILIVVFSSAANLAWADKHTKDDMFKLFEEYLLTNPEIIERAVLALQDKRKKQAEEQVQLIIDTNIDLIENPETMYIGGNPNGDVTLVEFVDFNCPFCKRAFVDIENILKTDKNIKTVMYEFPILGPSSVLASRAALAAKKQGKYWELHKALISQQGTLTEEAIFNHAENVGLDIEQLKLEIDKQYIDIAIGKSMELARVLGINGTPAFIINGKLFHGLVDIKPIIDQARIDIKKTTMGLQ